MMSEDSSVFTVEEVGERTVVSFRDWLGSCYREGTTVFVARAGDELKGLITQGQCKVLAIDMTPVDPMPSVFLGLLATLRKGGVKIQLLKFLGTDRCFDRLLLCFYLSCLLFEKFVALRVCHVFWARSLIGVCTSGEIHAS